MLDFRPLFFVLFDSTFVMSKRRESILCPTGAARIGPSRREVNITVINTVRLFVSLLTAFVPQDMLDMDNIHEFEQIPQPKPYVPRNWKRPEDTLYGYTGFTEHKPTQHVLDEPLKKFVIRGYSGFIPNSRSVCGAASVPTQKQQIELDKVLGVSCGVDGCIKLCHA